METFGQCLRRIKKRFEEHQKDDDESDVWGNEGGGDEG